MPAVPQEPTLVEGAESSERMRLLPYVLGALVVVSGVAAALVVMSGGGSSVPAQNPAPHLRASAHSLVVGSSGAPVTVVVYEDFGSVASRTFEISSRDFLRGEAARGRVLLDYRPVALADGDYSARALAAWGAVLRDGRASQALAFHDVLFDRQPAMGEAPREVLALARAAGIKDTAVLDSIATGDDGLVRAATQEAADAGVHVTPSVRFEGKPLTASSPTALADELQRLVLKAEG